MPLNRAIYQKLAILVVMWSLGLISDKYSQIRRYSPSLLQELDIKAARAPAAQSILEAIEIIKQLNDRVIKKLPKKLPAKLGEAHFYR